MCTSVYPVRFLSFLLLPLFLASCSGSDRGNAFSGALDTIPYDLENPELYELVDELHEISGISPTADGLNLLAINDERGNLYGLDLKGNIIFNKQFRKGGDYEDLATVGGGVYILTSSGNLHLVPDWQADSLHSSPHKSAYKDGLEFESLALDPAAGRLLMLVKDGEGREGKAPVYAFDVQQMQFIPEPVMLMDPKTVEGVMVKGKSLRGSAMALNPQTGHWYVVSAIHHILVVFDSKGNGIYAWHLPKKKYPQPEGLCFTANGDMYLTTEGLSKSAKLFRFPYRANGAPAAPEP